MQNILPRALPLALVLVLAACGSGCSQQDVNLGDQAPHILKQSEDRANDVGTTSNINQINQALSMSKDSDGHPPATLEDAKKAAHVPDSMWLDATTGKPLEYDPNTGTVHRPNAAPDTPPAAGAPGAPTNLKLPGAAGSGGY